MARRGRRPGASGSRAAILAAARTHFAAVGYDRATIRGIAAAADVDPALVLHFFGSKEALFSAAMAFPRPTAMVPKVFGPGTEGLGERIAMYFLETWESPGGASLLGLLRSVHTSEAAARMMRAFVEGALLSRGAPMLGGRERRRRATRAASPLLGRAIMRYVLHLEPVASASTGRLAAWIGPTIQRYFEPTPTAGRRG